MDAILTAGYIHLPNILSPIELVKLEHEIMTERLVVAFAPQLSRSLDIREKLVKICKKYFALSFEDTCRYRVLFEYAYCIHKKRRPKGEYKFIREEFAILIPLGEMQLELVNESKDIDDIQVNRGDLLLTRGLRIKIRWRKDHRIYHFIIATRYLEQKATFTRKNKWCRTN